MREDIQRIITEVDSRMKFVNIPKCITVTKNNIPDDIRKVFYPEQTELEDVDTINNLIMAVLLYIKDKTLSQEQKCTLENISNFLEALCLVVLPEEIYINVDFSRLSSFIVINVLQNSGRIRMFKSINLEKSEKTIRVISEDQSGYRLTDDMFDFLYRTKEVEADINFSVTRYIMSELMAHKNYNQALDQSRELLESIRNIDVGLSMFIVSCRENIYQINEGEYEKRIKEVRSLLDREKDEIVTIQENVKKEIQEIEKAINDGVYDDNIVKNLRELRIISENLDKVIKSQVALINKKSSVSEDYMQLLRDSFSIVSYERLDFEEDIIKKLKKTTGRGLAEAVPVLLMPLLKPELARMFSIENFYAPHNRISDEVEDVGKDIAIEQDNVAEENKERNKIYLEITNSFFEYASSNSAFMIKDYIESLSISELKRWCKDRCLLNFIIRLYREPRIVIKDLIETTVEPDGVLDLGWSIARMRPEIRLMEGIELTLGDDTYVIEIKEEEKVCQIEISNYIVEVIYSATGNE